MSIFQIIKIKRYCHCFFFCSFVLLTSILTNGCMGISSIIEEKYMSLKILDIKDTIHNNFLITCCTNRDTITLLSHFDNRLSSSNQMLEIGNEYILLVRGFNGLTYKSIEHQGSMTYSFYGFEFLPWQYSRRIYLSSEDLNGIYVINDSYKLYKVIVPIQQPTLVDSFSNHQNSFNCSWRDLPHKEFGMDTVYIKKRYKKPVNTGKLQAGINNQQQSIIQQELKNIIMNKSKQ